MVSDGRRRAYALLAYGSSRAAVRAAITSASVGAVTSLHVAAYGTRFAENVGLPNPHGRQRPHAGPST